MTQATDTDSRCERQAIRELIEGWAVWRDARDWQRFRTVWHADGTMMATWWQGPFEEFIRVSQAGWERGVRILHFRGGSTIEVAGERAIAQTKMMITQRAKLGSVLCDVICTGCFYDFFARREGRWGLVLRQPIYELDRLTAVGGGAAPALDGAVLDRFPSGHRHLAYIQTLAGYEVKRDMPGPEGEALERLYAQGDAWLAGRALDRAQLSI